MSKTKGGSQWAKSGSWLVALNLPKYLHSFFLFFFFFWSHCVAYGIVVPQPGLEPRAPTVRALSLTTEPWWNSLLLFFIPLSMFLYLLTTLFSLVSPSLQHKSLTCSDTPWHISVFGPFETTKIPAMLVQGDQGWEGEEYQKTPLANPAPNYKYPFPQREGYTWNLHRLVPEFTSKKNVLQSSELFSVSFSAQTESLLQTPLLKNTSFLPYQTSYMNQPNQAKRKSKVPTLYLRFWDLNMLL